MKNAAVDPVPTPTVIPSRMYAKAAAAAARFSVVPGHTLVMPLLMPVTP